MRAVIARPRSGRSNLLFLAVILLSSPATFAADIPEPQGMVNDYANVVSAEYRDRLSGLVEELKEKTSAEIAVVTVESIAPYDEKEYARQIFDKWRPGKKGKDNGVLVLLAIKERLWRIETGYGVEGILPDGLCGQIGRERMVPYFKKGRYAEGLYNGVVALARVISEDAKITLGAVEGYRKSETQGPLAPDSPLLLFILLVLIMLIYIVSLIGRRDGNYFGNGGYGGGTFTTGGFGGGGFGGGGFGGGGFGGGMGGGGGAGGRF